jgi:hypothetical protein
VRAHIIDDEISVEGRAKVDGEHEAVTPTKALVVEASFPPSSLLPPRAIQDFGEHTNPSTLTKRFSHTTNARSD